MKNLDLYIIVKRKSEEECKVLHRSHISGDEAMRLVTKYHDRAYIQNVYMFSYTLYIWGKDGKVRTLVDFTNFPSNLAL